MGEIIEIEIRNFFSYITQSNTIMVKPVSYKAIIRWISSKQVNSRIEPFIIPTKRNHNISLWQFGDFILIKGDSNFSNNGGSEYVIGRNQWINAMKRMKSLPEREKELNSSYVRPKWNISDNHFGPVCMLICRAYWMENDNF